MKKWEYKILDWHELPENGWLDGLGEQGWELVAVYNDEHPSFPRRLKYYFKREKF